MACVIQSLIIYFLLIFFANDRICLCAPVNSQTIPHSAPEDLLTERGQIGKFGGTLVLSQRSEPKTLNPVTAMDIGSKTLIDLLNADLIHINRLTQTTESALAQSWSVSPDGSRYTLRLRGGLRFSDGSPCTADDIVFTFRTYLDESLHSPQRDLLVISGKPLKVEKLDDRTVTFTLAHRYAAAERLFDSIAILPRHLLQPVFDRNGLETAWALTTPPQQIAGLGPFRLKSYVPGERIVLERNPYYWKNNEKGERLPYLNEIVCLFIPNAEAEAMRFNAGETDIIDGLSAADFAALEANENRGRFRLYDLGPGLQYDFLFFNQNILPSAAPLFEQQAQSWFNQVNFRKAISDAIDRNAIVRIAFRGRASPISVQVTPGEKFWQDSRIPPPVRSLDESRRLLRSSGFSWSQDGSLRDSRQNAVSFSVAVNAGNPQYVQIATLIQQDLKELGIEIRLSQFDFHTLLNRIFTTYNYEAAILGLSGGDSDPNPQLNVLCSQGSAHMWCLVRGHQQPAWQMTIDRLMQNQLIARDFEERKRIYDQVQELVHDYLPVIFLIAPDVLVGGKDRVGNFRPAILNNHTLWNAEQLFLREQR